MDTPVSLIYVGDDTQTEAFYFFEKLSKTPGIPKILFVQATGKCEDV
jgi:hypothetical protein